MRALEGRSARVLEIGSFEGLSACYLLWRLPDSHVTCVDTFAGSPEHVAGEHLPAGRLDEVFDANVALVDASRVRKLVGDSKHVVADLRATGARFEFVYVDGSHLALDVFVDAALSWQVLPSTDFSSSTTTAGPSSAKIRYYGQVPRSTRSSPWSTGDMSSSPRDTQLALRNSAA